MGMMLRKHDYLRSQQEPEKEPAKKPAAKKRTTKEQ